MVTYKGFKNTSALLYADNNSLLDAKSAEHNYLNIDYGWVIPEDGELSKPNGEVITVKKNDIVVRTYASCGQPAVFTVIDGSTQKDWVNNILETRDEYTSNDTGAIGTNGPIGVSGDPIIMDNKVANETI